MRSLPPYIRFILPVLVILGGCSSKEEEPLAERQPSPTPSGIPFTILSDSEDLHFQFLKGYFEKIQPRSETHYIRWIKPSDSSDPWDFALVRPWNLEPVEKNSVDLGPMVEQIYPKHRSDFFVPITEITKDGKVPSLPVVLIPDFLFAKNHPQWNLQFNLESFGKELEAGAKIGFSDQGNAPALARFLKIPTDQVVTLDLRDPQNPFSKGEVELAIGPKGWLLEKQVPGLSVISLAELGLTGKIPDGGYRVAISADCTEPEIAKSLLTILITEGQLSLVGIADALPIRRSVYSSPRVQGPLSAFYKRAFDLTLANLNPSDLTD